MEGGDGHRYGILRFQTQFYLGRVQVDEEGPVGVNQTHAAIKEIKLNILW